MSDPCTKCGFDMDAQIAHITALLDVIKKCEKALEKSSHFRSWDSESQEEYCFKDSLAYQEAFAAIKKSKEQS